MLLKFRLSLLLLFAACSAFAAVKLPDILSSGMVLQQKSQVRLWGKAAAASQVNITASWDNKSYTIQAADDGSFSLSLSTPKAGGPYTITFSDKDGAIVLDNILIGEVWLCSGQSNMEMPMKGFKNQPILDSEKILTEAANNKLRLFTTRKAVSFEVLEDCQGKWEISTPQSAANTSALAFQFGQMLQKRLNVPVGIIVSSWGGTPINAWMSRESLAAIEPVSSARPDTVTSKTPAALYNGMIAPLTPFAVGGFLWYQGENNHREPEMYEKMMPAMVQDWRAKFNNPKLPFYFVQIAPWLYSKTGIQYAPYFREMQYRLSKTIPNSGIAVTTDIGSNKTIHPPDKTKIAERLLRAALAQTYHQKESYLGPELKSMKIRGNKALLSFRHGKGLVLKDTGTANFEIAGKDSVFHKAKAEIVKGKLEVSSAQVSEPQAVRYAFKNYAEGNLFNGDGLPASSFRTDNWEIKP